MRRSYDEIQADRRDMRIILTLSGILWAIVIYNSWGFVWSHLG